MKLDRFQTAAAEHFTGPALILAGPGSGKTTVMTTRIINLINKYHISPEHILAVTFSRAAAYEMYRRYINAADLLPSSTADITAHQPSFGTFHSIFYHILRVSSPRQFRIISASEKRGFLRTCLKDTEIITDDDPDMIRDLEGYISRKKNSCTSCSANDIYDRIFMDYNHYLISNDLIDFDDMILKCLHMLSSDKVMLGKWQNKYQYILIDEFQDINDSQYQIIRLLEGEAQNIFAVGDDDQSIYGFRGSDPSLMKRFLEDHPSASKINLSVNYRSIQPIVSASGLIISQNKDRLKKNNSIPSCRDTVRDPVVIRHFSDYSEETAFICDDIVKLHRGGLSFSKIAVLTRRNVDAFPIIHRLQRLHIPYAFAGKARTFTDNLIFRDIICYISFANGLSEDPRYDLHQIINKPARYISDAALRSCANAEGSLLGTLMAYYSGRSASKAGLDMFLKQLAMLKGLSPYAALQYVLKVIGYEQYTLASSPSPEFRKEYMQIVAVISEVFRKYPNPSELIRDVKTGRIDEKLPDGTLPEASDSVNVMTMHGSKGLEFDTVYLPCVNEIIIPGRHVQGADLTEECRLLYVAMTRAARHLNISFSDVIYSKHTLPSRYIKCLLPIYQQQADKHL